MRLSNAFEFSIWFLVPALIGAAYGAYRHHAWKTRLVALCCIYLAIWTAILWNKSQFTGPILVLSPVVGLLLAMPEFGRRSRYWRCQHCGHDLSMVEAPICPKCNSPRRCRGCGYDLTGVESDVCPECGQAIAKTTRA